MTAASTEVHSSVCLLPRCNISDRIGTLDRCGLWLCFVFCNLVRGCSQRYHLVRNMQSVQVVVARALQVAMRTTSW
jgi:hypothetical protein